MLKRRQRGVLQSPWMVAVVALLLLLVVLLAAAGHSPLAVCCFVLVPVFLFSLVALQSDDTEDEPNISGLEDDSPSLFQRPPPFFA
jgi:Flp pilus assembly protein TadB